MFNLSFKELRSIVVKCCTVVQGENASDRYGFMSDFVKMENMFKQKKTGFHVMAFEQQGYSKKPTVKDLQLITEYVHTEEELGMIYNGQSEIYAFMVFSKLNGLGVIEICDENGKLISDKEMFSLCNDQIVQEYPVEIAKSIPMYRVLVVRFFNTVTDSFEYKVYIRSNYQMITYFKNSTKKNDAAEEELDTEENTEN